MINPEPGGGISNPVNFSIRPLNPVPRITSISPTSLEQGVNPQLVVITGTNFVEGATVVIGSDRLPATYVSPTELRLNIDGNRFRTTGGILLLVSNPAPGGGNSNWFRLTIVPARNPIPVLTAIAPATVFAGGENVTLTLTGSSFIPSSRVLINGEVIPSVYISASVLTVRLSSEQLVTSEAIAISVVNPEPGGGGSAPQLLTVLNPPPVLSALTPDKVVAGGPAFTLTLTGAGFVPESKIVIDGAARAAGYVSSTQLTLQVRATEITTLRTIPVQVVNPAPGGGSSKVLAITVRQSNPVPRVAAIRPSEVRAGGPGFILSVEGSRFTSESILRINGQPRDAEFVSESILAASIDPSEIAVPGELQISVLNPAPGGGQSGILPLRIVNPVPRITTINPIEVLAGGPELDLIVFGEGFASTSIVTLNESPLATTLVTGSQLRARIPAALTALGGLVRISVSNPSPGGGASNSVNLTIKNPTPSISRLIPASLPAGAGEANLTVEGAGFVAGSILLVNGQSRPATLVNSSRLSAKLPGVDTITAGMLSISVLSPEPAGGLSGSLQLIVENPAPQLTSLSQTSVVAGSPGFRLVLTGLGFLPGSVVRWSGIPRSTVYISDKSLAVDLLPADLATVGSATVAVFNPSPGGGSSAALTFSITPLLNVTPVISSITPATAVAGSPEVIITVNGSGFISGSTVLWAGSPRPTNLISPTQLTARISSSDLLLPGTFNVSVVTAGPGGGTSNQQIFLITFLTNVCQTVCLQSADYYLENLDQIPRGTIWVEGALYEVAAGSAAVRRFLSDTGIIAQQLTREFTATQLSVNISKDRTAVLNSRLSCYLGSFNPILLSSGSVVREQTTLNELFGMAREAVTNGRESESQLLLQFFQTLNGNYPYDRCR
ncbi:MAG: hypothetical protein EBZ36_03020 [Acidobacteria bacterium]|nr:hypothetical protein [Acidobacteriota bacterium]